MMEMKDYPLLEFDPTIPAIIEPQQAVEDIGAPEHCVFCFFGEVVEILLQDGALRRIAYQEWEDLKRPLYEMDAGGKRMGVFQPGVGAPLAAALMEEVIARGSRKIIACGGAGVLAREIDVGNILVPTAAVRDEGTSFHYLPPGREIQVDKDVLEIIEAVLIAQDIEYQLVKTWTTDAPYRETPEKVKLRKNEGCLTVEMEMAAFLAVAQFRQVPFGQILYGGDDISGSNWDPRQWQARKDVRMRLFKLAVDICLQL
ncbi:MAG: nucleoside phosphorylase [Anaerolineales bacterium]|nr:nucleoside phosphorylase [Anaerolineales bacterium]